jgi:hypothetical protein
MPAHDAPPHHAEHHGFKRHQVFHCVPSVKNVEARDNPSPAAEYGLIGLEAAQISKRLFYRHAGTASHRSIGEKRLQLTSCNSPPLSARALRDPQQISCAAPPYCGRYSLAFDAAARGLDRPTAAMAG